MADDNVKQKIIVIVEDLEQMRKKSVFQDPCIQLHSPDEVMADPDILSTQKVIIDGTLGNKFAKYASENGMEIKLDGETDFNYVEFGDNRIFIGPLISLCFNKTRLLYMPEDIKKEHEKAKSKFLKALHILKDKYEVKEEKDLTFKEIVVKNKKKEVFYLVDEIPQDKEDKKYIAIKDAEKLNRIFDIIDSVIGD